MDDRLYRLLVCPQCRLELELSIDSQKDGEIISGRLTCSRCESVYEIVNSAPMFTD